MRSSLNTPRKNHQHSLNKMKVSKETRGPCASTAHLRQVACSQTIACKTGCCIPDLHRGFCYEWNKHNHQTCRPSIRRLLVLIVTYASNSTEASEYVPRNFTTATGTSCLKVGHERKILMTSRKAYVYVRQSCGYESSNTSFDLAIF